MALDGIGRILSDGTGLGDIAAARAKKALPGLPSATNEKTKAE